MINKSKINSPQMWERWRRAGALSEHPEARERKEQEAQTWLERKYAFDDFETQDEAVLEEVRQGRERYSQNAARYDEYLELIREKPELTYEEMTSYDSPKEFGDTNNFWRAFFPRAPKYMAWLREGSLRKGFEKIGYRRAKRMHEAIERYIELDAEMKQFANDNPRALYYGSDSVSHDPRFQNFPSSKKKEYADAELEFTNSLRVLAMAMVDEGVPFLELHR